MHAQRIIQDLLSVECPSIHAKRRACLAATVEVGNKGSLSLMGISRALSNTTAIRHCIKRCDRLLGNSKLEAERHLVYAAMTRRIMCGTAQPLIIVDWSDLRADRSQQLLRAALVVQGRALTLYEEVHPMSRAASLKVHRAFLKSLKTILPSPCRPIFITDAGFRSTWFKLLDSMGYAWIGRIRNRDMVRPSKGTSAWNGCKTLYARVHCNKWGQTRHNQRIAISGGPYALSRLTQTDPINFFSHKLGLVQAGADLAGRHGHRGLGEMRIAGHCGDECLGPCSRYRHSPGMARARRYCDPYEFLSTAERLSELRKLGRG